MEAQKALEMQRINLIIGIEGKYAKQRGEVYLGSGRPEGHPYKAVVTCRDMLLHVRLVNNTSFLMTLRYSVVLPF